VVDEEWMKPDHWLELGSFSALILLLGSQRREKAVPLIRSVFRDVFYK